MLLRLFGRPDPSNVDTTKMYNKINNCISITFIVAVALEILAALGLKILGVSTTVAITATAIPIGLVTLGIITMIMTYSIFFLLGARIEDWKNSST